MGLQIVLQDSPLHRLLLHGIVQFHGLNTRVSTVIFLFRYDEFSIAFGNIEL